MKLMFSLPPMGGPVKAHWQKGSSAYIVVVGDFPQIHVYDRNGTPFEIISLAHPTLAVDWSHDGSQLAMAQEKTNSVKVWDLLTRRCRTIETTLKDHVSAIAYSKVTSTLAIGTAKGNLVFFDKGKVIPVVGKHSKRITMMDWSTHENRLAMLSDDRRVSVSNLEGDTLTILDMRVEVTHLMFDQSFVYRNGEFPLAWRYVSGLSKQGKSLMISDHIERTGTVELSFKPEYGHLTHYTRCGQNLALLGYSKGYLTGMALGSDDGSDPKTFKELFQVHDHANGVAAIAVAPLYGRIACSGDNCVKIHSLDDPSRVTNVVEVEDAQNNLDGLSWSSDEQLLAVGLKDGSVQVYLAHLPAIGCCYGDISLYLSNLKEISTLYPDDTIPLRTQILQEVTELALGPHHAAAVAGSLVTYYSLTQSGLDVLYETEFPARISKVVVGAAYAAVLMENSKIRLHLIDGERIGQLHETATFPAKKSHSEVISCCDLQSGFLVFGLENGDIRSFHMEEWDFTYHFKHSCGITNLFVSPCGLMLCFIDEKKSVFMLNMVTDICLPVPMPKSPKRTIITKIIWESWEENSEVFCMVDEENIVSTVVAYFTTIRAPEAYNISQTALPFGHVPLHLHDGQLTCLATGNRITKFRLFSHSCLLPDVSTHSPDQLNQAMEQSVALYRLKDAWEIACKIGADECFEKLGNLGLNLLEIEFAIRCYRRIRNAAMVQSLEEFLLVEDKCLLAGLVLLLLGETDNAQMNLLKSTEPLEGLQMRRDLLQWDQALQLAKNLAPEQIPMISREFAQDLELSGDYGNALYHYERSVTKKAEFKAHDEICLCGIARTSMRLGEVKKGVALAVDLDNAALLKDCAGILDGMKQFSEAAVLYEKAQCWEKAVSLYLKTKLWQKASELLGKCTSAKLHMQYAKAMEANGQHALAAAAYAQCKEYVPAIRLYLDHLNDPETAVQLVQRTDAPEAAGLIAKFFLKLKDYGSAIHFLVVSRRGEEAFELAKKHHQMDVFAEVIGKEGTLEEYTGIAKYFEGRHNGLKAGDFWLKAGDHGRALGQYMNCPEEDQREAILGAIKVVSKAGSEMLVRQLISYLMGDKDGEPKDAKYLFKMYMALSQFREAARTAIIIAREDQAVGNYRSAHDCLYRMCSELQENGIRAATDIVEDLRLLHSYMMAKLHVKRGDHLQAARLLVRAANNISKFPMHTVPILTSTVVECHRAGMRLSAFNVAKTLMNPEYRSKIDIKYKDKIERMIRRPDKSEIEEPTAPCPYCSSEVEIMRLDCPACKSVLPYCIFTGQHMIISDWMFCPSCKFPALCSRVKEIMGDDESRPCTMCGEELLASSVVLEEDPSAYLQELKGGGSNI